MKKILGLLVSLISSIGIFGQTENSAFDDEISTLINYTIPVISVEDAYDMLPSAVFVDARELEEYNVSHIDGAEFVGYDDLDLSSIKTKDRSENLIVYCSVGYRSEKVGEKLKDLGFKNVYNLYGGIFEWVNYSKPVVDNRKTPTDKVHTYNALWSRWVSNKNIEKIW